MKAAHVVRSRALPALAWLVAATLAPGSVAVAQVEEASLLAPAPSQRLGWSVAVSGATAAAAAPGVHTNSIGSVHVFRRVGTTWVPGEIVQGSTTVKEGWFGFSIALDGEVLVAGDWGESDGEDGDPGFHRGAAFVFRSAGGGAPFLEEARLQPVDLQEHDRFGSAVALHGDVLAVSARGADDAGSESGAVYVYRRLAGTWTQEARLVAPVGSLRDRFGYALALSGSTLVIGAEGSDLAATDGGSVYVFAHNGSSWALQATLTSPAAAQDDRFGSALGLEGDLLAVGVPRRDVAGVPNAGAVDVFQRVGTNWSHEATLVSPAPVILDNLGHSLAVDAGRVLAGRPNDDTQGAQAGAAVLFAKQAGVWSVLSQFIGQDIGEGDQFAWSVALDGSLAVVGSPFLLTPANTQGAVVCFGSVPGGTP